MILLVDPDIDYLESAKAFLKSHGSDVLIAEDSRELISLCFEFANKIGTIMFDPGRLDLEPTLLEGLEYVAAHRDLSRVRMIEWKYDNNSDYEEVTEWVDSSNV